MTRIFHGAHMWTCGKCQGEWQTLHSPSIPEGPQRGCQGWKVINEEHWWFIGGRISHRGTAGMRTCMVDWPGMKIPSRFFELDPGPYLGCRRHSGHPDWESHHFTCDTEWCPHVGFWGSRPLAEEPVPIGCPQQSAKASLHHRFRGIRAGVSLAAACQPQSSAAFTTQSLATMSVGADSSRAAKMICHP